MSASPEEDSTQSAAAVAYEPRPAGWWGNKFLAGLPVLACFLGGATEKWSEGIIVALIGIFLLIAPPRFSLGTVLNVILLALAACAAAAFLPAHWFFQPSWRLALVNDFGIKLPGTLSPQPWLTLGCFISFLAGLSWLYVVSTQELELRAVRSQLRLFAGGMVLLAALCLVLYYAKTALPFWHNERGFGPFPNRNQTGSLLGLTAIVIIACGQDDIRQKKIRWIAWLAGLAIIIAAVILNFSRAGVLFMLVGCGLWIGWFTLRRGWTGRIAIGLSILLGFLTLLLVLGGETLERFHLRGAQGIGISSDFRWLIFQDVFRLIRSSPWCGVGLGNFEPVFAIFRDVSLDSTRSLHPESDWFWLWAELGWPALILAVAGVVLFVRRVFPLQEGTNQRFRLAALIAALMFMVHGLVDVSGHRFGTALAGILVFGLALRRPLQLRASRWTPVVFRVLGILLLAAGIAWTVATRYELLLPGAVGAMNAKQMGMRANRGQNFNETIRLTNRALEWSPLDWQLYFLRAAGKIGRKWPSDALDDFRRARYLEPNSVEVPFQEGIVWLPARPVLALTAWREALRRAGPKRAELYASMLSRTVIAYPAIHRSLERFSAGQHDLLVTFLEAAPPDRFDAAVQGFFVSDPNLATLTSEEKRKFFSFWAERGNLEALAQAVDLHPEWLPLAWEGLAKLRASKNDFRAAYELARKLGPVPTLPRDSAALPLEQLQQNYYSSPGDYSTGFALYREQIRQGKIDDALGTVRHFTAMQGIPSYFYFLEAEAWAARETWERAWKSWQSFQEARKKELDGRQ